MSESKQRYLLQRKTILIVVSFLLLTAILVWPVPYYTVQPGSAIPVDLYVESQMSTISDGRTHLMTVHFTNTSVFQRLIGSFRENIRFSPKAQYRQDGESDRDYFRRQSVVMLNAQSQAMQVAYKNANIAYSLDPVGAIVLRTISGMPAFSILQSGDRIIAINGEQVFRSEDIVDLLQSRTEGEIIDAMVVRSEQERSLQMKLDRLENGNLGIGAQLADGIEINPEDDIYEISLTHGGIGGPSAGMMFALEIYNRLTEDDITRGYLIAGTGAITADGEVTIVGSVDFKVIAADRIGVELFFVPYDLTIGEGRQSSTIANATIAQETADRIGSDMRIIPVASFQDVLDALHALPPK